VQEAGWFFLGPPWEYMEPADADDGTTTADRLGNYGPGRPGAVKRRLCFS
jgi:hypothetical protein